MTNLYYRLDDYNFEIGDLIVTTNFIGMIIAITDSMNNNNFIYAMKWIKSNEDINVFPFTETPTKSLLVDHIERYDWKHIKKKIDIQ